MTSHIIQHIGTAPASAMLPQFGDKVSVSIRMAAAIKSNRSMEEIERLSAMFQPIYSTPSPCDGARSYDTPATVTRAMSFMPASGAAHPTGGS